MLLRSWASRVAFLALAHGYAPATRSAVVVEIPAPMSVPEPAAFSAPFAPPVMEATTLLGRWVGVGRQDRGSSWDMLVDIVGLGPGVCGRVRYPTLPCAAEWICSEGVSRGALRAREHVTEGHEACVDGGEMTMTLLRDGRLAWTWTGSGEKAHAFLSRAEARR